MEEWRKNALGALEDAKAEILGASEPTILVVVTIGNDDLLKEKPLSIYANQKADWLHRVMAFAAWRLSLKAGS